MVVRHTIHKLRQRPEHERAAFASAAAIGIGTLLFLGWVIYFLSSLNETPQIPPAQQTQQGIASTSPNQVSDSGNLQVQQIIEATSDPYQVTTTSWGN